MVSETEECSRIKMTIRRDKNSKIRSTLKFMHFMCVLYGLFNKTKGELIKKGAQMLSADGGLYKKIRVEAKSKIKVVGSGVLSADFRIRFSLSRMW
jgi:hypothetical protein